jgi:hypothetical protein
LDELVVVATVVLSTVLVAASSIGPKKSSMPKAPGFFDVDVTRVVEAPEVSFVLWHDGPGHTPVRIPTDKLMSMMGFLEDAGGADNMLLELLVVVIRRVLVVRRALFIFEERQDVPGQTPVRTPTEKLMSMSGLVGIGRGRESTGGRRELVWEADVGRVEDVVAVREVLAPFMLDERHWGPGHKSPRILSDKLISTSGRDRVGMRTGIGTRDALDERVTEAGRVVILEVGVVVVRNVRHEGPGHKPPSNERETLMSIRGGGCVTVRDETGVMGVEKSEEVGVVVWGNPPSKPSAENTPPNTPMGRGAEAIVGTIEVELASTRVVGVEENGPSLLVGIKPSNPSADNSGLRSKDCSVGKVP